MGLEGSSERSDGRRAATWLASRPETRHVTPASNGSSRVGDICFAFVVVVSGAYFMYAGRNSWFFADEWAMAEQVRWPSGLFKPYNGHLSVLILGLYRALLEVFGFADHAPYRVAGVVSFLAVAAAMYVVVRREVGTIAAAAAGVLLLWPAGISIEPGGLNHSLTAVGAIVCAYGLNGSGRRRDLLVGGGLTFALLSAGGGVAVMAACAAHCVFTRPPWRRWIVVALPSALWAIWYQIAIPDNPLADAARPGMTDLLSFTVRHAWHSFSSLTLGNRFGGVLVAALVAFVAVARLRQGIAEAAGTLAWIGALIVWWFGIAWSRWFAEGFVFRYEFVSAVIILLALLPNGARPDPAEPSTRIPWPEKLRGLAAVRFLPPAVMGILLLVVLPTSMSDLGDWGDEMALLGRAQRRAVMTMAFERPVPEPAGQSGFAYVPPSRIRILFAAFSPPPGYGDPGAYVARAVEVSDGLRAPCPAGGVKRREIAADGAVLAVAQDSPITVKAERFGFGPQVVAEVPARSQKRLDVAGFGSKAAWTVSATGGCLLPR